MMPAVKRQVNIASFFSKAADKGKGKEAVRSTIDREAVTVVDDSPSPNKRRKLELPQEPKAEISRIEVTQRAKGTSPPVYDDNYPPPDHPSYHPPPGPTFNHPIEIPRVPDTLKQALKFNKNFKSIQHPDLGLDLQYFKPFIDRSCTVALTKYLLDSLPWYRVKYTVRGININTPRYTTVFGKDATNTPWNGYDKAAPRAIPRILLMLMQQGMTYNFVLVNYYSGGSDSISYHSDSESFLGPNPCIASLSLGGTRDFTLRHVKYKENNAKVEKFALGDGDMVVMRGRTQHDWQHSVPKRKSAEGRINITFRKGIVKYATQNYYQYNVGTGSLHRWENGQMVEKG